MSNVSQVVHATKDFNQADENEDGKPSRFPLFVLVPILNVLILSSRVGFLTIEEYSKTGHYYHVPTPKDKRPEMHKSERYHSLDANADGKVTQHTV